VRRGGLRDSLPLPAVSEISRDENRRRARIKPEETSYASKAWAVAGRRSVVGIRRELLAEEEVEEDSEGAVEVHEVRDGQTRTNGTLKNG